MNTTHQVLDDAIDDTVAPEPTLQANNAPIESDEPAYSPAEATPDPEERRDLARLQQFLDKHAPEQAAAESPSRTSRTHRRQRPRPRRSKPLRSPASSRQSIDFAAHQARCTICCDPERDAIEEEFVHWHNTRSIARIYDLDRRAIYRHAHALNLFAVRDRNLRYALGHIIEDAEHVNCNADSVIRAVHAFTRVNNEGQWIEPPSHVIVSSGARPLASRPSQPAFEIIDQPALPAAGRPNSAENPCASLDNGSRSKLIAND